MAIKPTKSAAVDNNVPSVRMTEDLRREITLEVMKKVPTRHTAEAAEKARDELIRKYASVVLAEDAYAIWANPKRRHLFSHISLYAANRPFHVPRHDDASKVDDVTVDKLIHQLRLDVVQAFSDHDKEWAARGTMHRALASSLAAYTTTHRLVDAHPELAGAVKKVLHARGKIITERAGALTTGETQRALAALVAAGLKLPT